MEAALEELASEVDSSKVTIVSVAAEKVPEVSVKYKIVAVPTTIFIKVWLSLMHMHYPLSLAQDDQVIDRVDGCYVPQIIEKVRAASRDELSGSEDKAALNARLLSLINRYKCMVFMKGNPNEPRCGERLRDEYC